MWVTHLFRKIDFLRVAIFSYIFTIHIEEDKSQIGYGNKLDLALFLKNGIVKTQGHDFEMNLHQYPSSTTNIQKNHDLNLFANWSSFWLYAKRNRVSENWSIKPDPCPNF